MHHLRQSVLTACLLLLAALVGACESADAPTGLALDGGRDVDEPRDGSGGREVVALDAEVSGGGDAVFRDAAEVSPRDVARDGRDAPSGDASGPADATPEVRDGGGDSLHPDVGDTIGTDAPLDTEDEPDGGVDASTDTTRPDTICAPDCGGRRCGSDGCGGVCGRCALGSVCDHSGACVAVDGSLWCDDHGRVMPIWTNDAPANVDEYPCSDQSWPGPERVIALRRSSDGPMHLENRCDTPCQGEPVQGMFVVAEDGESPSCMQVPNGYGRDFFFEARAGETYFVYVDSPEAGVGGYCYFSQIYCPDCQANCEGRECGTDGCHGTCGPGCADGQACNFEGLCVPEPRCVPACEGRVCGEDGCGGECGPGCADGEVCWKGACREELPYPRSGLCQYVGPNDHEYGDRRKWPNYDYDAKGRLTRVGIGMGAYRSYSYNYQGLVVEERMPMFSCPSLPVVSYAYVYETTAEGVTRPIRQDVDYATTEQAPDETWTFEYDDRGRRVRSLHDGAFGALGGLPPDGETDSIWTFTFDDAGRVAGLAIDGATEDSPWQYFPRWAGGPSGREYATYFGQGLMTAKTVLISAFYDVGPPDGVADQVLTWQYRPDGQSESLFIEWPAYEGEGHCALRWRRHEYVYDEQGRLVEDTAYTDARDYTGELQYDEAYYRCTYSSDAYDEPESY